MLIHIQSHGHSPPLSHRSQPREEEETEALTITVLQSLSLLWNSFQFLLLHVPSLTSSLTSNNDAEKEFLPTSTTTNTSVSNSLAVDASSNNNNKWKDVQSQWVWYLFCTHFVSRCVLYLDLQSAAFLTHTAASRRSAQDSYSSLSFIQFMESASTTASSSSSAAADGDVALSLAGYELLCSGVELCLGLASYLR
jgi:hypothetical protein